MWLFQWTMCYNLKQTNKQTKYMSIAWGYLPKAMDGPLLDIRWYPANVFILDDLQKSSMNRVKTWKYILCTIIFKLSIKDRMCQCTVITHIHIFVLHSTIFHFIALFDSPDRSSQATAVWRAYKSSYKNCTWTFWVKNCPWNIHLTHLMHGVQGCFRNILDINHLQSALVLYFPDYLLHQ